MDEQRSRLKDLSSLVTYHYSSLAAITKIQRTIPVVQPRPNIRSHSVLLERKWPMAANVNERLTVKITPFKDADGNVKFKECPVFLLSQEGRFLVRKEDSEFLLK